MLGVDSYQLPNTAPPSSPPGPPVYAWVTVYYDVPTDNSTQSAQIIAQLAALPQNVAFMAALATHFPGVNDTSQYSVSVGRTTALVGGQLDSSVPSPPPPGGLPPISTSSAAAMRQSRSWAAAFALLLAVVRSCL